VAQGVAFPFQMTARGGLKVNRSNIETVIMLELMPRTSSNPFDEYYGLTSPDFTFQNLDSRTEGMMRRHISDVFARREREGRARLREITFDYSREGELRPQIEWVNLETGQSRSTTVDPSGGVSYG